MSEDVRGEPFPPRRPGRPEDEPDVREWDYDEEPPFPPLVKTAGIIWIVFGCLILVYLAAAALLTLAVPQASGQAAGAQAGGAVCGLGCVALFAAAFLFVGVQSVRGTAGDTLGNGVGSIIFAILYLSMAVVQVLLLGLNPAAIVGAAVAGLSCVLLLTAGVLALLGRRDYKAWRRWQKEQVAREAAERKARRRFQQ